MAIADRKRQRRGVGERASEVKERFSLRERFGFGRGGGGTTTKRRGPSIPAAKVRMALVCALFAGCAGVLGWRLYTFQIVDTERYQRLAEAERHGTIPIAATRGALLDTTGSPLAVTVRYDSVFVLGNLVGGNAGADKLAATLSPILGVPEADLRASIDPSRR